MAIGESAGILFKIKGDASDAISAFNQTEREAAQLTGTTAGLTSSFSSLAGPALAAGAAVTVIATAAIAGTRALFEMTKSASEFGSQIFDASQKTGLTAERLSAMKFAADQSGTSLDSVTAATARFSKVIGDAGNGSAEAQKKLERLGVTSTDLDTALKQALATIVKVPPGAQQMALAMDAFGKSGADLLPFIRSFDGDLDALTQKAKELGVTITDEAAAAADEFGDQLDTLNAQFAGVGRTIGNAFMPIFLDMARSLSDFLTRNQSEIQQWGTAAADIVRGFIVTLQDLDRVTQNVTNSSAASWLNWSNRMLIAINPVAFGLQKLLEYMRGVGNASKGVGAFAEGTVSPLLGLGGGGGIRSGGGGGRGRAPVDNSAREAEQLAARDLSAQVKIEAANLKQVQESLSDAFKKIREDLFGSDVQTVQAALLKFTQDWVQNLLQSLKYLDELETQQLKADATDNERAALKQQQEERRHKIRLQFAAEIKKTSDDLFEAQLEQGAALADAAQKEFEQEMDRADERRKRFEEDAGYGNIPGLGPAPLLTPDQEASGIFDAWTESWQQFYDTVAEGAPVIGTTLGEVANIVQDAFQGLANSIGSVVQQYVLYGNTAPAIMRKVLATALATIAAEAAVQAIKELAYGFAALAFGNYEAAAFHFGSAALFGSIAGVAALAGRAVAGNAFKQQTGAATGSAGSGNRSSSGSQGEAYSSYGNEVLVREQGRNATASQPRLLLTIKDDSRWLGTMLKAQIEENGQVRDLIRSAAEA